MNHRSNLPDKMYRRLASDITRFCERHGISFDRFAELAGVPGDSVGRVIDQSGAIKAGEWKLMSYYCQKRIPDSVVLAKDDGLTGFTEQERDRLDNLAAKAGFKALASGESDTASGVIVDSDYMSDLRQWMDDNMVSSSGLAQYVGIHESTFSRALNPGYPDVFTPAAKTKLLEIMTAPGLPPISLFTAHPNSSHRHIPEAERMKRFWSMKAAYEAQAATEKKQAEEAAAAAEESERKRQAETAAIATPIEPKKETNTMANNQPGTITLNLPEALLSKLSEDATAEFRSPDQQAAWIISKHFAERATVPPNGSGRLAAVRH